MNTKRRPLRLPSIKFLAAASIASLALGSSTCVAQIVAGGEASPAAPRLGNALVTRYRVGVEVGAAVGGAQRIRAMVAVPLECPEQRVEVFDEDYSREVEHVDFRMLPGDGAKQLLVQMPRIDSSQTAHALITYNVTTHAVLPPEDMSQLVVPKRPDRELKRYLGPSPYINVNHRRIRAAVAEALDALDDKEAESVDATPSRAQSAENTEHTADAKTTASEDQDGGGSSIISGQDVFVPRSASGDDSSARSSASSGSDAIAEASSVDPGVEGGTPSEDWRRVEALYDYALKKVEYKEGVDKSAVQVLQEGVGDCQAIGALFVAMCRTVDVPARLVWVHDHQYAEFYLEDAEGQGYWYPVETAGQRAFGEMPLPRVILQKGDDFRVPERPRERLRYASDYLLGFPMPGGGKPRVKYIREQL